MNNRKIILIIAATLLMAIVIIIIFVSLAKNNGPAVPPDYSQYIEDLKKQGAGASGQGSSNTGQPPDEIITYTGQLLTIETGLEGNTLTMKDSQTGQTVRLALTADTTIIYGAKQLQTSDLHAGDELRVNAKKNPGNALEAKEINVIVSTSPTVPTQVNVPAQTPGVILPPSKRNIL